MTGRAPIRPSPVRFWALSATLALAGCFHYVPAEPATVPVGNDVRVELTRVGFAELPEIPTYSGPDLDGTVVRAEPDRLLLRVPVAVRVDGLIRQTVEQEVAIPSRSIVQVQLRELDRTRTGLSVAAGIATLGAVFLGFKAGGNDTPEIPDQPPEEEAGSTILVPLLSFPFR